MTDQWMIKSNTGWPGEIAEGGGKRQIIIDEFSGESFHIALTRPSGSFEFTYAEIGAGTSTVEGDLAFSLDGSYAQFCVHHYDQNGLVDTA